MAVAQEWLAEMNNGCSMNERDANKREGKNKHGKS